MQPNALAARAYSQNARSVGTPRSIELQAFTRITAGLRAAAKPEVEMQQKIQAVLQNSNLWGVLANDLLSENNALPKELRAQLVSLAEFSRKHGLKVIGGGAEIEPLIDINVTVMRGLRGAETSDASAAESSTAEGDASSTVKAGGTPAGAASPNAAL